MIFPGRIYSWNNRKIYKCFAKTFGASRHFTVVFTAFVYMQVFNMINARKIHDELNICANIFSNVLFIGIWVLIAGCQFLITQYTRKVFEVSDYGLDGMQWIISLIFGIAVIPVTFIVKFLPDSMCPELGKKKVDDEKNAAKGMEKKSSSQMRKRISQRIGSNSSR
jgi:Ca2+ transporting ATPase